MESITRQSPLPRRDLRMSIAVAKDAPTRAWRNLVVALLGRMEVFVNILVLALMVRVEV